ncbi:MAG TPA: lytic transglycosylase domain-containing protein [Puia sp.]|nr:lytic transglycosylase domain-containing protein [Puia sp.]
MLKAQVPFYVCSIAFAVSVPSAANPGPPAGESTVLLAAARKHRTTSSKKPTFSLPLPPQQSMKFVSSYIRHNDDRLIIVKHRSEGPFAIIDSVLDHYHLPLQLKYLAVIESELKASARSRVGARGPWQLMPSTAHVLGLKVNRKSDERTNYYKSTQAAAEYLRDLHREFGDWLLVLAAYNGGPRPVYRAIRRAHSRNFWTLQRYLPAESRRHVKKFIATAWYFESFPNTAPASPVSGIPTAQTQAAVQSASPAGTAGPASIAGARSAGRAESDNEKFRRLMQESAISLKSSNELLSGN